MPQLRQKESGRVYLNAVRLARELRGWSQRELAQEAGRFAAADISTGVRGESAPCVATARELADALDVHPDAIFPA